LAKEVDLVLMIGSHNSENSNQLCRVARLHGAQVFLINNHHDIESNWLQDITQIGITSGASVPEQLVQETAEFIRRQGAEIAHLGVVEENVHFTLPPEIPQAIGPILIRTRPVAYQPALSFLHF